MTFRLRDAHLQPEAVAVDLGDFKPPGDAMPRARGVLIGCRCSCGSKEVRGEVTQRTASAGVGTPPKTKIVRAKNHPSQTNFMIHASDGYRYNM